MPEFRHKGLFGDGYRTTDAACCVAPQEGAGCRPEVRTRADGGTMSRVGCDRSLLDRSVARVAVGLFLVARDREDVVHRDISLVARVFVNRSVDAAHRQFAGPWAGERLGIFDTELIEERVSVG